MLSEELDLVKSCTCQFVPKQTLAYTLNLLGEPSYFEGSSLF